MPDNDNENTNAYNYNPNRPQNNVNPPKDEHADTKKVVDTAAKGAAEYFAPGVGGMAYDAAKSVPVVGDTLDKATDEVAKTADKIPGVKKATKALNDSGVTDVANEATSLIGSKTSGGAGASLSKETGASMAKRGTSNSNPLPVEVHKNTTFNRNMTQPIDDGASNSTDTSLGDSNLPSEEEIPQNNPEMTNEGLEEANDEENKDNSSSTEQDVGGKIFQFIWERYKVPIILGGGGAIFLFLILLIIFGGFSEENQTMGYMDSACNYNETKVNVTNCYLSSSESVVLGSYNIDELVIRLAHAYSLSSNYSDETLKALMIVLKTNILGYGNYNSSNKNVDIRICDVYSDYQNSEEEDQLWMLMASSNDLSHIENLYDDISGYLYVSSSYRSTISNLSSANVLEFSNEALEEFEALAASGNTYSQILNKFYNTSEEASDEGNIYRDTLFLGDSRTRGMQLAGVINDSNTIYGEALGYNWLIGNGNFSNYNTNATSGGIDGINNLMKDNTDYNIFIWLGVNDISNVNSYYEEYEDLASGEWSNHNIYIVSVGPVIDSLSSNVKNEDIDNFNSTMASLISSSGLSNLFFIDLGYREDDIEASDGIHYSSSDYQDIYSIIMSKLDGSLNADYQLYNLTTYCAYYTLTENDAYWWPIGSNEATSGNIYGGDPVSTRITSYFGPRNDPIEGYVKGHGAIDIGVSENTPVIATKSGTISFTNTGCSVGDHSCGGGYGNYIRVTHDGEIESLYAHLKEVLVEEGDSVNQGQIIGYSGNTGRSTGPHLHFEIRINNTKVDPLDYVDPENPRPVQSFNLGNIDDSASTPEENKEAICHALLDSGFSENAVAGMLVNISAEGGFKTNNLENCYEEDACCKVNGKDYGFCVHPEISGFGSDTLYTSGVDSGAYPRDKFINDRAGYGLIQWTSSNRKAGLYDLAKEQNKSISSLSVQLDYLLQELSYDSYQLTYKYITGNYSAYDVANIFCQNFESPSNEETTCPARASANASTYLEYVQNGCSN